VCSTKRLRDNVIHCQVIRHTASPTALLLPPDLGSDLSPLAPIPTSFFALPMHYAPPPVDGGVGAAGFDADCHRHAPSAGCSSA
jgi:hypothetical protein